MSTSSRIQFLYIKPKVGSEDEKLQVDFIHYITLLFGISLILVSILFILFGELIPERSIPMGFIGFTVILCRYLLFQRRISLSGHLLIFFIWLTIFVLSLLRGGIYSPTFLIFIILIPMSLLINGVKSAYIYSFLDLLVAIFYITIRPNLEGLDDPNYTPFFVATIYGVVIIFTAAMFGFANDRIQSSQARILDLQNQLYQSQKLEALGRFAGGIAHDFNNILTAIVSYSRLLERDPDNIERYTKEINKAIHQAQNVTSQLLTLSKKQVMKIENVNVNYEINQMRSILRTLTPENIEISYEFDKDLPFVSADVRLIQQVILNLITNARDSIVDIGTIRILTKSVDDISLNRSDITPDSEYIALTVVDNGIGMSPEIIEKAFDPFFTTKDKERGTGLGLSIVYSIVNRFKGKIDIDSTEGVGTRVTIFLPVSQEDVTPNMSSQIYDIQEETEKVPEIIELDNINILLVEDDDLIVPYLTDYLQEMGANIDVAYHPRDAMSIIDEKGLEIDLLLSDIVLPEIDGVNLATQITNKYPRIKVILMSGYPESDLVDDFNIDLKFPFIQKPFVDDDLIKIIDQVMNH
ncbi:MAG: hybrid sensor histidine kinase/response regulator [Candidatus Kariarchaeaceae archaeon]